MHLSTKYPVMRNIYLCPLISRKLSQQDWKTAREVHYQWSLILLPIYSHWLWSFSWAQSLLMWASLAVCSVLGVAICWPTLTDPESCSLVPSETPIQAVSSATGTAGCFSLAFFSKWEIMLMFWRYFDFFFFFSINPSLGGPDFFPLI